MEPLDRRAFIARSGAAVAAVGAAVLLPGELVGAATSPPGARARRGRRTPLVPSLEPPGDSIIAHVRNLSSGEIAVFARDEVFVLHDRALAAGLARAAGGR